MEEREKDLGNGNGFLIYKVGFKVENKNPISEAPSLTRCQHLSRF